MTERNDFMKPERVKGYGTYNKNETSLRDIFTVLGLCFACVAVIAGTFWVTGKNRRDADETQISSYNMDSTGEDYEEIAPSDTEKTQIAEPAAAAPDDPVTVSDDSQPVSEDEVYGTEPVISAASAAVKFSAPLKGKLLKGQSGEELVYSKTLEDWRLHDGIDVLANIGSTVCATADGVVEDAYKDARFGYTIVIEHSDGMKSVYSNLTGTKMVKIGKDVKCGDPIGMVGDTAICEALDNPHLHYEMILNGAYVNPLDYFSIE